MTKESRQRTITLTDRPPVRIREDQWPEIAHGRWADHDGQIYDQANRTYRLDIRVRQHTDGRAIVYGVYDYDTLFQHESSEVHRVGLLLDPGADIPQAIKEIAYQLIQLISDDEIHRHVRDAADECIGDLPVQDLT